MHIEKFMEKMQEKFPNENYAILYAGKNSSENSKIKCLDCGRIIIVNTGELFRRRRQTLCVKCHYLRCGTFKNREIIEKRLENKANQIEFFMERQPKNGNRGDKVRFVCNKCGRINEMFVGNLIEKNSNCDCCYCSGQKEKKDFLAFKQELEERYPEQFTLLSDYINVKTKIKVRCNRCDFIRFVKPNALLRSGSCPKCSKKKSLDEDKIQQWLKENKIKFETQKFFQDWDIGLHYFDFYLPSYNLVIEFQGKQHYEYTKFFHKNLKGFDYQKKKDALKKEEAIKNGLNYLSIKYTLLDNIDILLSKYLLCSTTISKESRGICLEIESLQKEEDIV